MNYHSLVNRLKGAYKPSFRSDHVSLELRIKVKIGVDEEKAIEEVNKFAETSKDFFQFLGAEIENSSYIVDKYDSFVGSVREKCSYDAQFENVKEIY